MKSFQKASCHFLVQFTTVILLISITSNKVTAQSMGISSSAITPDASSILEMRTSTKGLLMPRLTTTERDAITSPATGLIIYNTTTSKFNFYNGSSWIGLFSGSSVVNSVTGTSNRITIGGTAADPTVDISSSYAGQSSITTLGTIGTGVWNGTIITSAFGGTGNGFTKFTGATTSEKTYTLPNANATILTDNAVVTVAQGGIGVGTLTGLAKGNGTSAFTAAVAGTDYLTPSGSAAALTNFPTLNQNTTGSAATLTTSRLIHGGSFNGSADVTNIIASTFGGTGNGFSKFSGAATTEKTYTLPNANATILTDNAVVTVAQGGIGVGTLTGLAKGNGTSAFTAAVAGTDYLTPTGSAAGLTGFPTLNQNTTGSAATLTTARNIYGNSFNGSADLTQVIASTFGGTGNGFTKFSGPTTAEKTFTLPNASATILTDNATVTAAQGGTGNATYAVGDLLYASASTTLSKLAGVATGNALISGGVTTAPSWGKIGLTTHVSGILPIANGGTNSSTVLNNNRIMVSSGGTITESAALTNGQLLIGSTSAAPVAATLTAGNGIAITNAAGAITIANEPAITMATGTSTLTTTSTTDVALSTPLTITPGAGDYLVFFTGVVSNSLGGRGVIMSIFVNGTKVAVSEILGSSGVANDKVSLATNTYVTGIGAGQAIEMRWRAESNTASITNRTLIVQRVK